MKKLILPKINWFLITITMVIFFQNVLIATDEIEQVKQAIATKGANWTTGESWVTELSPEEYSRLCGSFLEPSDPSQATLLSIPFIDNLPSVFDWRNNNGNWVTPVKNQGGCGSCWDFSAVAQVEVWWKIHHENLDSMIDLSEQFVLSCSDGSCSGWSVESALDFINMVGIPTEACFPYKADDSIPCSDACNKWADEAVKIPGWGYITLAEDIIDNIKNAVYHHPVSACFMVYADFRYYSGGIYEHVWGNLSGGHCILIVGWNDREQSWICKNSWGPGWGEEGYFRIKWSNCGMGKYVPFIWNKKIEGPALVVSPDSFDLSLTLGDSIVRNMTITNQGFDELEYSLIDHEVPILFHPDSFMAWDDLSWWCGDPEIGGYDDLCLQYLDTPILDLSKTNKPHLSWMGFWAIEDPSGASPPWDGWDGCNVWLSVDGGKKFKLAYPVTPQYTCQSLYSFGSSEIWNMGAHIAGWAGTNSGWTPVEFDLSPYRSDSVIIRYAFASDGGLCTVDDPLLYGFFIDEIKVSDGSEVLFENHGTCKSAMKQSGYGSKKADWIDISNSIGVLQPNESALIDISFRTKNLEPGNYNGLIRISSNDKTLPLIEVPCHLNLQTYSHDIAVQSIALPFGIVVPNFPVEPEVKIENVGLNDATDFDIVCTIFEEGQAIYNDTTHVPLVLSAKSQIVKFKPFLAAQTGQVEFSATVINFPDDHNSDNNFNYSKINVTNLVDGFETEKWFWAFDGGWGITDLHKTHSGNYTVHVNNGFSPYLNNMNATMTLTQGFDLHAVDNATFKFWTRYITEKDKDICYVEVSGDRLNWSKMDSLSGGGATWKQCEVGFFDFINAGCTKVWLRFHFVSDNENTAFGVLIDDVEIYSGDPSDIHTENLIAGIPDEWNLMQNYPNPFNKTTRIEYSLPVAGKVTIIIYNIKGQVVRNLLQVNKTPGYYFVDWDGCNNFGYEVGTGIYFYHLDVEGNFSDVKKMIFIK